MEQKIYPYGMSCRKALDGEKDKGQTSKSKQVTGAFQVSGSEGLLHRYLWVSYFFLAAKASAALRSSANQ